MAEYSNAEPAFAVLGFGSSTIQQDLLKVKVLRYSQQTRPKLIAAIGKSIDRVYFLVGNLLTKLASVLYNQTDRPRLAAACLAVL